MAAHKKKEPPKFADISFDYWKLFLECRVRKDKLPEVTRIVLNTGLVLPIDYLADFPTPSSTTAYA